jgi:hypothetical protein
MTCTTANSTDPEIHRQTINEDTVDNLGGLRWIAFAAMIFASFALYAAGVLALHRDRTSWWHNGRSAMATAGTQLQCAVRAFIHKFASIAKPAYPM